MKITYVWAIAILFCLLEWYLVYHYPTVATWIGVLTFLGVFGYAVYFLIKNRN